MRRLYLPLLLIALCLLPLLGGCSTPAEQKFAAADVRVLALYVQRSQPAVEAYADATGDEQLRIDTRLLAAELAQNAAARLDRLRASSEAIEAARTALTVADAVLDAIEARKAAPGGQEAPQ